MRDLHAVWATPPLLWAEPVSPASSWTRNAPADSNFCRTTEKNQYQKNQNAPLKDKERRIVVVLWFSLIPQACSPQIQPAEPEPPETSPSPHYSKACPPRYPYAAVNSTGGESVCAWEASRKTSIRWKEGLLLQEHATKITAVHSQNEGDVVDKIFDSKKHKKGGYLPFFPAVGRNFGDFCFVLQEKKLVIYTKKNKQTNKRA